MKGKRFNREQKWRRFLTIELQYLKKSMKISINVIVPFQFRLIGSAVLKTQIKHKSNIKWK